MPWFKKKKKSEGDSWQGDLFMKQLQK